MEVSRMGVKDNMCLFHLSITCWFVRINQGIELVKLELARWLKLSIR